MAKKPLKPLFEITLMGVLPPSVNSYYKRYRRKVVISEAGQAFKWEMQVAWNNSPYRDFNPTPYPVILEADFYFPRNNRDIDNPLKALFDSLEGLAYENDKQIQRMTITKAVDKKKPRTVIRIYQDEYN